MEMLTCPNKGKYCLGNNQSDFRSSSLRHRISPGHIIMFLLLCPQNDALGADNRQTTNPTVEIWPTWNTVKVDLTCRGNLH